jgi:hypothetical protein
VNFIVYVSDPGKWQSHYNIIKVCSDRVPLTLLRLNIMGKTNKSYIIYYIIYISIYSWVWLEGATLAVWWLHLSDCREPPVAPSS